MLTPTLLACHANPLLASAECRRGKLIQKSCTQTDFGPAAPKKLALPAPNGDAIEMPQVIAAAPAAKSNLLLLIAIFFMLGVPLFLVAGLVLFLHLRKSSVEAKAQTRE